MTTHTAASVLAALAASSLRADMHSSDFARGRDFDKLITQARSVIENGWRQFLVVLADVNGERTYWTVEADSEAAAVREAFNDWSSMFEVGKLKPESIQVEHVFPGQIAAEITTFENCAQALASLAENVGLIETV